MFPTILESVDVTFTFTDKNDASVKHTWSYAKLDTETDTATIMALGREIAKFFPDSTLTRAQLKQTHHIQLT